MAAWYPSHAVRNPKDLWAGLLFLAFGLFDAPAAAWIENWDLKLLGYVRMARAVFPIMQAPAGSTR